MTLSDIGELVVLLLVCISVPSLFAISKLKKGEDLGDPKSPIIWPLIVAAVYAYYVHSINPYWSITPFIGTAILGIIANSIVFSLIERRIKEKEYETEERDRRDKEIRELRKEIKEMKEKDNH